MLIDQDYGAAIHTLDVPPLSPAGPSEERVAVPPAQLQQFEEVHDHLEVLDHLVELIRREQRSMFEQLAELIVSRLPMARPMDDHYAQAHALDRAVSGRPSHGHTHTVSAQAGAQGYPDPTCVPGRMAAMRMGRSGLTDQQMYELFCELARQR